MTLTNLIDAARQDAQSAAALQAKIEALLAASQPQIFTAPEPEPEPKHLVVEYHHENGEDEAGHTTEDLIGAHFVGPMAGR